MAVVGDVSIAQLLVERRGGKEPGRQTDRQTDRRLKSSPSLLKNVLTSSANRMTIFGLSAAATTSSHHELHNRTTTARVRGPILASLAKPHPSA